MPDALQTNAVRTFECLGDRCPDTCCKGWNMQLAAPNVEKYRREAPALLEYVEPVGDGFIMKRDAATDYCVKFEGGWCGIQKNHGAEFLGDACYFFPRVTRALGETLVTSAALSCPETARLMLVGEAPFQFTPREEIRVPYLVRNYLPPELSDEQALAIHAQFVDFMGAGAASAERAFSCLAAVARGMELQPVAQWSAACGFYLKMAEGRLPAPEPSPNDPFNVLHAFFGLIAASPSRDNPVLLAMVQQMADRLGVSFDGEGKQLTLADDAAARSAALIDKWRMGAVALQPVLRRYLQAQLSQALFPFGGFGTSLSERITIIGVRFATVKLALAARLMDGPLEEAAVIETIQRIARFIDHLAEPELSLQIYRETGWVREARLRGLIGDL